MLPQRRAKNPVLAAALEADPELGRWNYHKRHAGKLVRALNAAGLGYQAYRVGWCCEALAFGPAARPDGLGRFLGAESCHFRFCPMCQARRSAQWGARLRAAVPVMMAEMPATWAHLTLTVRNCDLDQLGDHTRAIHEALHRMTKRAAFGAVGWLRNTETTLNPVTGTAHPHVHMLLALPPDYYRAPLRKERRSGSRKPVTVPGYMTHREYLELWRDVARLDYAPSVRIQAVKLDTPAGARALYEVSKYGLKPASLSQLEPARIPVLLEQLAGTRSIGVGGELRRFLREPDEDDRDDAEPAMIGAVARWNASTKRYERTDLDTGEVTERGQPDGLHVSRMARR